MAPVPPLGRRLQTMFWLLLVVFAFYGVFGHSLWGANDVREGGMIWDVYRHGTWVTPTINGKAFLEKPPLLHWTSLVFCHLGGRVTEGLVRLPAALYGFGTLVLIDLFVTGARAPGESGAPDGQRQLAAWAAVFLCATAIEFQEYSRIVLTDIALTFMVTLSLFLFWRAYLRPGAYLFLNAAVAMVASRTRRSSGLMRRNSTPTSTSPEALSFSQTIRPCALMTRPGREMSSSTEVPTPTRS